MQKEQDFHSTREQFTVEIRKQNRDSTFNRKRMKVQQSAMEVEGTERDKVTVLQEKYRPLIHELETHQFGTHQIDELCKGLGAADDEQRLRAAVGLRKVFSGDEAEPHLQRILDNGAVTKLIALMKDRTCPQLQFQACWVITNIAYGSSSQCEVIVSKDGLDAIMQLLYENTGSLLEQALWGLGNIAGDCANCRNTIIMKGGVECVIRVISNSNSKFITQEGAWVLSNLCSGQPLPKYELIKLSLPVLGDIIIQGTQNSQILTGSLWALAHHSQGKKAKIRHILKVENLVTKLIELCYSKTSDIVIASLRVIGNISTGSQSQTNQLLNNHVLAMLLKLLTHSKRQIRRETCWTISNICAGTLVQIQKVLLYPALIDTLMQLMLSDQPDVRREVCFIFGNMCHLGSPVEIYQTVVQCHFLQVLAAELKQEDIKTLESGLKCLYQLLSIGSRLEGSKNLVLLELKKMPGLLDRLQTLQLHTDPEIYKQLQRIFQRFFTMEVQSF